MALFPSSENAAPPSSTPTQNTSDANIFSDELRARASSPPSSPPGFPWEQQPNKQETRNGEAVASSPLPPPPTTNVFSILGKRKPLATISDNAATRPKKVVKAQSNAVEGKLTQMRMSLGQAAQKKCTQCGMEYTASSAEDRKLHDKFHKQNTEGIDVGKDFVAKTPQGSLFKGVKEEDAIVSLWCFDTYHRKRKGQAVLDMVQKELGAVPIPEEDIWDAKRQKNFDGEESRHRAYLYIRETKCVGFLLVESIQQARRVIRPEQDTFEPPAKPPEADTKKSKQTAVQALRARREAARKALLATQEEIAAADGQPLQLSPASHPATLGISRIWTSSTHRSQGIAKSLLTTAIVHHNKRYARYQKARADLLSEKTTPENEASVRSSAETWDEIKELERKEQVAFSQPTNSGARLARKWYGNAYGWSVYVD